MTVQRKQLAKGSKLEIAEAGESPDFAEFGRIVTLTLPPQDYETVEVPELNPVDDEGTAIDSDPIELGDSILGEFSFTHYWDPMHDDATAIDEWWAGKTELTFRLTTPHPTEASTITWNGKLKQLAPTQLEKKDYYKRTVTGIRTGPIAIGDATPPVEPGP
jgi:hypothetical protein